MKQTDNLKIDNQEDMITPKELKEKYKAELVANHVNESRKVISNIIN
jgi:3-deoxy-D-arabino-heptulosonate 7-phosphate (DAHP) synthase